MYGFRCNDQQHYNCSSLAVGIATAVQRCLVKCMALQGDEEMGVVAGVDHDLNRESTL